MYNKIQRVIYNLCLLDSDHWQPEDCVQNKRSTILIALSKQRWNHFLVPKDS